MVEHDRAIVFDGDVRYGPVGRATDFVVAPGLNGVVPFEPQRIGQRVGQALRKRLRFHQRVAELFDPLLMVRTQKKPGRQVCDVRIGNVHPHRSFPGSDQPRKRTIEKRGLSGIVPHRLTFFIQLRTRDFREALRQPHFDPVLLPDALIKRGVDLVAVFEIGFGFVQSLLVRLDSATGNDYQQSEKRARGSKCHH